MSESPDGHEPPEREELLTDFVARQATARPDAPALGYQGSWWSWREWQDRIQRLAGALVTMGVRRGDRVACLEKNHPAGLETVLAAATLGAAVVMCNWRLAADELAHVLGESRPRILFHGTQFTELVATARSGQDTIEHVVVIGGDPDAYERLIAQSKPPPTPHHVTGEDVALIVHSSGTTGRPKGVLLSQRALVTHTVNVGTRFPFAAGDRNLVAMPLFHVGGVCYALLGIRAGAPTLLTREPRPAELLEALGAGATHAFLVPPVIAGLLDVGGPAAVAMSRLRFLGYGAAPTPLPLLRRALSAWPDVDFVQVYGQTELSGVATTLGAAEHRDRARPHLLLAVGTPVPGCEVRVVDPATGANLPPEERGELWVRTRQAMSGYLGEPEATAETITRDGWLRTGDIGHLDAEGYVYLDDRLKDMIISGGENVYGPEVERVLLTCPGVRDAAVVGVPHPRWGEAVHALVVADEGTAAGDVIAFCHRYLAGYKCPLSVGFVLELPRNTAGKVLKRQLRCPGQGRTQSSC
ncbi:AMP-binding protein [Streptomyces sp. NPDC048282]|uniref:AMP-binding protein n=1 Tax=Streptomyces sp. NPDC048282 TaxID=3365528 RepID=UPI003721F305